MNIELADLITIALLIVLEGVLSADNALVLAVMVLALPESQRLKALRYGIGGAFVLRFLAILFAAHLISLSWVKLIGGLYLLYLPIKHFRSHPDESDQAHAHAGTILGLSVFWSTVVRLELTDLVFAIDSILAAVGLSQKLWVIITGGFLGLIAMRLVVGQILTVVRRYPALVDGAYIIIAWVGFKLLVEYFHHIGVIGFSIPKQIAIGVVVVLFIASYLYARARGPAEEASAEAVAEAIQKAEGGRQ